MHTKITEMEYIATVIHALMSVGMFVCGAMLWRRRLETGDKSRYIQAVLSWVSALFAVVSIFRIWTDTTVPDGAFFVPEHTFVPLLVQMTYFLYPLEVIHPAVGRTRVYALLFIPLLMFVFVGMCAGIEYTAIYTYDELWQHLGEFNVWFRLLTLFAMLFYSFALFLVPYNWRESSADRKFIMNYSLGFCLMGISHFSLQLFHAYWLLLLHQVLWFAFFLYVAYYELHERLQVSRATPGTAVVAAASNAGDRLWEQTVILLNSNEKWRSPELSLTCLSEQLESNRTYVGESFKQNTGMTFVEYITHRRISYVVEELKKHPEANIHELFNYVGYRQRSTAYRNFQKITGMSPTEFLNSIK